MSEKQDKNLKVKGSIVYELLAVVLAVALLFTLIYPNTLWEDEEQKQEQCRENLQHILFAEITYMNDFLYYNDTLQVVVDYILSDTTESRLEMFTDMDTVLTAQIIDYFVENIQDTVQITQDSLYGEEMDSIAVVMREIAVTALIDSMKKFVKEVDLSRDSSDEFILDSLRNWPAYAEKIDSMSLYTLNNLFTCPTSGKQYKIKANNDSTIKFVDVFCPLDSTDQEELKKDFKRYRLGGLRIENHGSIENFEKSWQ